MTGAHGRPVVAILSGDPEEARDLAERIVEDGLVPWVAADAAELAGRLEGPLPPDVLLVDPDVPGADAVAARTGGPAWVALGRKPPGRLGVVRPIRPATLSRRLAWALHARAIATGAVTGTGPGDELRAISSLVLSLNGGDSGRGALQDAVSRFVRAIGGAVGRLVLATPAGDGLAEVAAAGLEVAGSDAELRPVLTWCQREQRPLRLVGPVEEYPQFAGRWLELPVVELLAAPVVAGDESLGVLAVASREPGRLGPEKLALVITAARVIAGTVQRNRLERAREHHDRLAMLGQLAAGVAHELSNPLALVSANLGYLSDGLAPDSSRGPIHPEELRELLEETREGVHRMIGLVQDLRSAGRQGRGDSGLVDLDALARRAAVLVGAQFKHHVEFRLEPGCPPPVQAEGERLLQILLNLLINAGQAMDRRGVAVVRTGADGSWAYVEVEDDGPGVPEALVDRIFEPFFTTKAESDGTGLGLSISLQIARGYGGDLTVSRAPGGGARFTLRLPGLTAGGEPALDEAG